MSTHDRIAIVTGGNRGIGFEICRQLAKLDILVVLTSRNEEKGMEACERLHREELPVRYHQLDVSHAASIVALRDFIIKEFGRCDILVNNAGIFPDTKSASSSNFPSIFESDLKIIREAMETNVYGPILLCQSLIPLMKEHGYGRVVNLSSGMGQLTNMNGHCPGYRISKTSINAVTRIFADELQGENVLVNSMCPGWVKTEMGGPNATREPFEGAETAVWLATLPNGGPTGKFFRDKKEFEW
ncbi:MAG: SDR family oxidoreductase [Candidatus Omnitrophica bacterium]|nr:SDR family oxidoreductase [Candidatus Omnitrophota bacterium]MCB9747350.1 SDR family oxidoreductase [Candidatus Omnitrophota bacterium]